MARASAFSPSFATWVLVLAELEEIAITTTLPEWRTNVPSIFHARRVLKREFS